MASVRKVGFIGGGKMARALAQGFISSKVLKGENIIASAVTTKTLQVWKRLGCHATLSNSEVARASHVIFLAVKPHLIVSVLDEIKNDVTQDHLVVSVATAVPIETMEQHLPHKSHVMRVLPNLASSILCGVSAYSPGSFATLEDKELFHSLLSATGYCVELKESLITASTSVSGCGLAFMALAMEALSDGGVKAGLPRQMATDMAVQALIGSARLVQETAMHPAQLKDDVCSPGGTTIVGVQSLERAGFRSALIDAVDTVNELANKMSQQRLS